MFVDALILPGRWSFASLSIHCFSERTHSIIIIQGKEERGTDLEDDALTEGGGTKRIFTPPEKHAQAFSLFLPILQAPAAAGIGIW